MKKILILFVALAAMLSFMSCEEDGIMSVSVDDNNADSQWNYDLEGKTLSFSEPNQTMDKTTTTVAGTSTSVVTEEIVLTVDAYTITFGEMTDDVGTFTMTYTETATAAADTAYVSTATVVFDNDFDNTGFAGIVLISSTVTGTYEIVELENEVEMYSLTATSGVRVQDNAYASVPTTTTTYTSAGATTRTESYTNDTDSATPGDDMFFLENEAEVETVVFPLFAMYGAGLINMTGEYTVSE